MPQLIVSSQTISKVGFSFQHTCHISPYPWPKYKLAAWVIRYKLFDVQYASIQDHQLLSIVDSFDEFLNCNFLSYGFEFEFNFAFEDDV